MPGRTAGGRSGYGAAMSLHISHLPTGTLGLAAVPPPFSLRLLPGVEYLDDSSYARTFRLAGVSGWLRVRPLPGLASLELTLSELPETLHEHLERHVRHMFDLDRDPAQIQAHFADDPLLGPLVAASPALRLPAAFDPFEQAVRAVVGQQVSIKPR